MNREGFGLKIIGKINLENLEKKEQKMNHEKVREKALLGMEKAYEKNIYHIQSFFDKLGAPENFIDDNGAINALVFKKSNNGYLEDQTVDDDIRHKKEQNEEAFSKKRFENNDGPLAEKISALILNKLFKNSDYILVNTHAIDDNDNGVDQLIMNVQTGEVICALDDLVSDDVLVKKIPEKGERFHQKIDKILRKNTRKKGAELKYGAIFKNHNFEKLSPLKELPLIILKIERKLFYESMRDMDFSIESNLCNSEENLVRYMISSLENQISDLSTARVSYDSVETLIKFLKEKTKE